MPTTYLESFGADLSENKLFQCVSILLTGTSTSKYGILPKCNQKIIEYRCVGMLQTIVKSVDVIMFSGSRIHFQMRKPICSTQKLDQE